MIRRVSKTPLEYAVNFVEIAGETARHFLQDKAYLPTAKELAQLRELQKMMSLYHASVTYIIRTLEERVTGLDASHTDDLPDPPKE